MSLTEELSRRESNNAIAKDAETFGRLGNSVDMNLNCGRVKGQEG